MITVGGIQCIRHGIFGYITMPNSSNTKIDTDWIFWIDLQDFYFTKLSYQGKWTLTEASVILGIMTSLTDCNTPTINDRITALVKVPGLPHRDKRFNLNCLYVALLWLGMLKSARSSMPRVTLPSRWILLPHSWNTAASNIVARDVNLLSPDKSDKQNDAHLAYLDGSISRSTYHTW